MKMFYRGVAVCLMGASLAACATDPNTGAPVLNKQNMGTLLGGAGGAVVGSQFGKGKGQLVGVAVGTLLGAGLGSSIGKSLDQADMTYYNNASQNALETAKTGNASTWRNPDSGTYGTITPVRTYQSAGKYCREYTQTINVGGRTEEGYGKACRQPDGSWKIVQ